MLTGTICLKALAILLSAFGLIDLIAWITGGQTLTQFVIIEKAHSILSRLIVIALIVVSALFLLVHFELLS